MKSDTQGFAEAERALKQAQRILAHPINLDPDEWMLVATLIGEADLTIRADGKAGGGLRSLLQEVVGELRDATNGFRDPEFVRSTRAARRRNKDLFTSRE
ncbi:MAG: hypothetical protein ABIQ32_03920 [Sphingomicrobium sp.]